ncbi:MAG: hypothetical protein K2P61_05650 [Burkholderiaceae bacterium]|nr:hypothetical protein [Burkholderiaceae bacterium]
MNTAETPENTSADTGLLYKVFFHAKNNNRFLYGNVSEILIARLKFICSLSLWTSRNKEQGKTNETPRNSRSLFAIGITAS